jgi:hypothetical protein
VRVVAEPKRATGDYASWRSLRQRRIAAQLAQAYPLTNAKRTVGIAAGVGMYPDDRAPLISILAGQRLHGLDSTWILS